MTPRSPLTSNLAYGKKVVDSGIRGAISAGRQILEDDRASDVLSRAARDSWKPAAIGACIGVCASLWKGVPKRSTVLLNSLVGTVLGFGGGVAWNSRNVTSAVVRGAIKNVNMVRDEHWLEQNPVNYA